MTDYFISDLKKKINIKYVDFRLIQGCFNAERIQNREKYTNIKNFNHF